MTDVRRDWKETAVIYVHVRRYSRETIVEKDLTERHMKYLKSCSRERQMTDGERYSTEGQMTYVKRDSRVTDHISEEML